MPKLPRRPNLEHLKHQARALQKAHVASQPDALERVLKVLPNTSDLKLTHAQFVVAREYGFPNWARLKAFVEAAQVAGVSSRQQRISNLLTELLGHVEVNDAPSLGARFALMPLGDILDVREVLLEHGTHARLVDVLLIGLTHPQPRVRYNCAQALDHLADARCTEPLRRLFSDPVPRVRRAALHSLSCDACKINPLPKPNDLMDTLIDLAQHDPNARVRRAALENLMVCMDLRVDGVLVKILARETDAGIVRFVQKSLKQRTLNAS